MVIYSLTPFGGSCCITPGTVPGATCVLSSSGQVTTTCTWTRRADDVRYTYTVPSSIPYIYSVTLKGTHGEWLDVATPDAGYQRGSIFKSGYFAGAFSRTPMEPMEPKAGACTPRPTGISVAERACRADSEPALRSRGPDFLDLPRLVLRRPRRRSPSRLVTPDARTRH